MSATEQRFPAKVGFNLALLVMGWLVDVAERLEIAGSLRRGKQDLGDVELVMMPKFKETFNLFGDPTGKINLLDARCDEMLRLGLVEKRLNKNDNPIAWGERYKALLVNGIPLDLFIVLPDRQWGPTMLIRTGPGSANQVLVTQEGARNREGNVGILPTGMIVEDGQLWKHGRRVDTPEEQDVFAALDMPYIPPYARTVQEYQLWASRRRARYDWQKGRRSNVVGYGYREIKWKALPTWDEVASSPAEAADQMYTSSAHLNIAPGLRLRAQDFVGKHTAVLGMTGMGKSNLVSVLIEELAPHIQISVIDLEGEYRSLRDVHPFLVIGKSEHDDRLVSERDATRLADEIMESGQSVILDLYDFDREERDEFLRLYLDRLFEIEGRKRQPHIVVLEEAAEFLNQRRHSPVTEAAIRLANRGRKRGISMIMVSQRPAALDKHALDMARNLFLLGVQFAHDISAYRGMLPKTFDTETAAMNLLVGQALVRRSGEHGGLDVAIHTIRKRKSVDLGATPELDRHLSPEMA